MVWSHPELQTVVSDRYLAEVDPVFTREVPALNRGVVW